MNILLICSSKLPNPPVRGGAVPELLQEIINLHEEDTSFRLTCLSVWEKKAEEEARPLKNAKFIWSKTPFWASILDTFIRFFLLVFKKNGSSISWGLAFHTLSFELFVKKTLRKYTFDKVIFENSTFVLRSLKNKRLLSKYSGKCFYHAHGVPKSFFGTERIIKQSCHIICVSSYIAHQFLSNRKLRLDPGQVSVLYNGIDMSTFYPISSSPRLVRKQFGFSDEDFVVLFVGRLNPQKGISELIEGVRASDDPSVKLLIVGSPFYGSSVKDSFTKKLIEISKSISSQVFFTGYVKHCDLPKYYCAADCIALPSTWEEPGSIAVIEALACGRPLITTISGGTPEYVGKSGAILLNKESQLPELISQSILALKNDPSKREELSRNALIRSRDLTDKQFYESFKKIIL